MSTPATVVIFWDYDTQWGADRSRSGSGPKDWGPLEFENTERLLDLHAEAGIPACFAVVGAAALPGERPYHDPVQIQRIHAAGHEVASHSLKHDWLPGLSPEALRESLRKSKDALEQCIGSRVRAFVPPYNQPFDFPQRLSFSISERRNVRRDRVDVRRLCETLSETGYEFCRLTYRSVYGHVAHRVFGGRSVGASQPFRFGGITCLRMNTQGGFGPDVRTLLERGCDHGGVWIVYGHPHSLSNHSSNQREEELLELFKLMASLKTEGRIRYGLPGDFLKGD